MGISFSAHISNKSSAITGKSKLCSVAKHNMRLYKTETPRENCYDILRGTNELYSDVTNLYHNLFDEALREYNNKQTREERKIPDYFDAVCKKSQDIAVEMIVQIGDISFWERQKEQDKDWRHKILPVYRGMLEKLEEIMPEFKIANAVIHYDETSPHMHIVGVPVRNNCVRGLKTQVSKRDVFTKDTLANLLQGKFRDYANEWVKSVYDDELVVKKQGRNHDLTVTEYKVKQEKVKLAEAEVKVKESLQEAAKNVSYAQSFKELADKKAKEVAELEQKASILETKVKESENRVSKAVREVKLLEHDHDEISKKIDDFSNTAYTALPEAKAMMSAKTYKERFVDPFVEKIVSLVKSALCAFQNLLYQFRDLQREHEKLGEYYRIAKDRNKTLYEKNEKLEKRSDLLYEIEDMLGDDAYKTLVNQAEAFADLEYEKRYVKVR
ncbi:MAG: plasmid recombination protein [Lachnospiraceae bacterium]|nr:plasmid recombination protein [Lachnospiraceae bacterium]